MHIKRIALVLALAGVTAGCASDSDTRDTQRRTLTGTAIGAAGGALIGSGSGKHLTGAAIGAAAGTASGYLYDRHKKKQEE